MTLQKLKAMNLALEALMYASYEDIEYNDACAAKVLEARNALKEALAQPEQEPVRLQCVTCGTVYADGVPPQRTEQEPLIGCVNHDCAKCKERIWVGLTDKDLDYLCHLAYSGDEEFALAVQAKLKEKNK